MYEINSTYRAGRFSTMYNAALSIGKEFIFSNRRVLGFDIRGTSRNGFREPVIQPELTGQDYILQLPPYFRADLRISYKKEKKKSTAIWSLDIQNVSNSRNVSYHYYDDVTGKVEPRYQLGIIPVLGYKVMF
jgi:outer membrane receptor protein involved in Fe transport